MRWLFSSLLLAFSLAFVLTVAPGATASTQLPALANLARDRPTFCSSIEATCTLCCYAVDGDPATRWSSQFSDPGWIYVDLGASARIERVILRWEAAYGQAYQVQTSHDAVNWSDIYSTTAGTEQLLRHIDWEDLTKPDGLISMGYTYDGARLAGTWNIFGGESWLIGLAYASATGTVAPTYPSPPTANGSGFIDELAWLFVPPPAGRDYWGTDWAAYRRAAADRQIYYYPSNYPRSCFAQLGLFGLSAAEVPDPSLAPPNCIYQAFGVGGRDLCANDGSALLSAPVTILHYAGLIASLRPVEAAAMWAWLMVGGFFSPLNNVDSLMFPPGATCDYGEVVWNQLKGAWNLSLQTLGWGRYPAQRQGQMPVLWQAALANAFLREGYDLLAPDGPALSF